ncbi:ABC transporter permease [Geobacillus subterraneus]|uniref:ABC transporter permease n=2 Tax=Geobacillus TaxID=129337 RepID=A0ABM6ABI7_9BACL|nr:MULTISPECIES: branched-chain amino acid ABC transporter permease [Geobacillus]AMX83658.1 ABC transporter permease [Geobacillus subterraneus]KZS24568.1 ABC transporter permease [Geobacillus subterraneus]OXB87874.1 branched-chain amino acid ABC transporter permease [Geobacillus uzenensis]QIZ67727.1 branched-chain amino acid ABC transporter permease [Geobacillus subterraneus]WPZ19930.1 branched-chain amino acid ABC transporter permease [Geobacillus subterraneus]
MAVFEKRRLWLAVLAALALAFPLLVTNGYYLHMMTISFIWMIAVYGLNLFAGYTGYLSLAHAGFFAVGAYTLGILTVKVGLPFWWAFVLSCAFTSLLGLVIGLVALRTKEHFFAIYTLCVGYIIYLVIDKWDSLTGGVRGFIGIPAPGDIGPLSFQTPVAQYYLVLFFLLAVMFVMYRLVDSLTGRTYIAIRNSEELALTLGISTMKNKLASFVLSVFFTSLAGALYASFIRFLGPDIAYVTVMFDFLTYLLVGGIGTLAGPVVGTLLITFLSQQLQFLQDYRMLIFGPVLTLLIIFYPHGIAGGFIRYQAKRAEVRRLEQRANRTAAELAASRQGRSERHVEEG